MKSQEREVDVLLSQRVALEEDDSRHIWDIAPPTRFREDKAVVGEKIEGSGRESGHGLSESFGGDGETGLLADAGEDRQVVLQEAGKLARRRSRAGIDTLFVL